MYTSRVNYIAIHTDLYALSLLLSLNMESMKYKMSITHYLYSF